MSTFTYTTGRPAGNISPAAQRASMQTNNDNIPSLIAVDHIQFNQVGGGFHNQSTYVAQGSDPTPGSSPANQAIVYSKTVNGIAELFISRLGSATPVKLTSGAVSVAANGYTFLPGGLILQWGSVLATTGGTAFTFPKPFTTAVYSITLGMRASGAQSSACTAPSLSSTTVYAQSGTQTVYVMAIGV